METKAKLSSKSHRRPPLDGLKPGRTRLSAGQSWDLQQRQPHSQTRRDCEDLWREPVGAVHLVCTAEAFTHLRAVLNKLQFFIINREEEAKGHGIN